MPVQQPLHALKGPINGMALWLLEYVHQKIDHQLAISKHLDGTP